MDRIVAALSSVSIPSRFRRDVSLASWRKPVGQEPGSREPEGSQRPLFDWLVKLARENERAHRRRLGDLRTRADLLRHAARVRRVLRQVQGLAEWPARTPLRPRVGPGFCGDGFRVEHVVFESRPAYYVTANLYLPAGAPGPLPAVLLCCGHSLNGKAYPAYQRLAVTLARLGFAVLIFDPAGQGERDEYVARRTGRRTVVRACRAHGAAGLPACLLGSNFGAYRLWDAMRCVDYLQGRPDVDPRRIGATGTSGGGWESLWLAAIDPRIRAVHANCYFTTFRRRIENRAADAEPDPEQDPFDLLGQGIEASDLILACAPRPVSIGGTTRDFFPVEGLATLASLAEHREYAWAAGVVVPEMLKHFDLPDVRAALAPRPLLAVAPRDHRDRPLSFAAFRSQGVSGGGAHVAVARGLSDPGVAAFLAGRDPENQEPGA